MTNREFYDSSYCTKAASESWSLGANDPELNFSTTVWLWLNQFLVSQVLLLCQSDLFPTTVSFFSSCNSFSSHDQPGRQLLHCLLTCPGTRNPCPISSLLQLWGRTLALLPTLSYSSTSWLPTLNSMSLKKQLSPGKEVIDHDKREKTINLKPLTSEGVVADKKCLQKKKNLSSSGSSKDKHLGEVVLMRSYFTENIVFN